MIEKIINKIQVLKCPVGCGKLLGRRQDFEDMYKYCPDCNWTYRWKPLIEKPVPAWKGRKKVGCGCNACGD